MPGQIFEFAGVWMSLGVPLRRRWPWITAKEPEAVPLPDEPCTSDCRECNVAGRCLING